MPHKVTIQKNGRVVLPAAFRAALGLEKGRRYQLVLDVVDGQGVIRTELDQVRDLQARFAKLKKPASGADELEMLRRAKAAAEDD